MTGEMFKKPKSGLKETFIRNIKKIRLIILLPFSRDIVIKLFTVLTTILICC